MWPKYSLRRLLINVTVLCAILAFVVQFPIAARSMTILLLLFAPTLVVIGIACFFSQHRMRTFKIVGFGAFLGWASSPKLFISWASPPTFWDLFIVDLETVGMFTAGAAFLFAFVEWVIGTIIRFVHGGDGKSSR